MACGASYASASPLVSLSCTSTGESKRVKLRCFRGPRRRGMRTVSMALRPTAAESARTIVEVCSEGTLSTISSDGWPVGSTVQFALDLSGSPVFSLRPGALHVKHLLADSRSSLHTQLDQFGRRAQCTLKGRVTKADNRKFNVMWERRFGEESPDEHELFTMNVDEVLHSQDLSEQEHVWVPGLDYSRAVPDPLKDSAARIVEDMNKKNWEDILRFCRVFANLEMEVEQASLTWVDRLGFDMRVLTSSPARIMEVRIPFEREALDDRDARSLLTMMGQVAWEKERSKVPAN